MRKYFMLMLAMTLAALATQAQAQTQYNGQDYYVKGETAILGEWGVVPAQQVKDDGTGGDLVAGDGIYSVDVTVTSATTAKRRIEFKISNSDWSSSFPSGNAFFITPAGTAPYTVKFMFNTNTLTDGYSPEKEIVYTNRPYIEAGDTVRLVGNFISELGGSDWTTDDSTVLMTDDGTGSDTTASDGIYTALISGVPAGSWEFKVTINGTWDYQVSSVGFANGGNIALLVIDPSDQIKFTVNKNTGRWKLQNDNPLANPGPPFFATSAAWSDTLSSETQLNDTGLDGDVVAGDGIYGRQFVANAAGTTWTVEVRQGQGPTYPDSGAYPFRTSSAGQQVLVQFDTNTYSDGYTPSTRIVWTDPGTRNTPSYVQATGDFMVDLGAAADWVNNDSQFQLFDNGQGGDVVAGDWIFAKDFTLPIDLTDAHWKAVGQMGTWNYQYGGPGEGATYQGGSGPDNDHTIFSATAGTLKMQVDTQTGRIGTGATLPTRPATFNAQVTTPNAARNWSLLD